MGKTDDAMISGARPRPQRAFVLYPRLWLAALMLATGVHSPAAGASDNKNDSAVPFKLPSIPWLQKPAATPTPPPVTPAVAAAIARNPQRTRSQAGIVALFQKRVVNGGDLVDELRVIKQLSTQRRSESAALALMGRMNGSTTT